MTEAQAYIIWKCTGRAEPALVPEFRARRAAELLMERVVREARGS